MLNHGSSDQDDLSKETDLGVVLGDKAGDLVGTIQLHLEEMRYNRVARWGNEGKLLQHQDTGVVADNWQEHLVL